ncbi:MAG: HAMP domain-containing histidine kinase, partial [Aequorivita sp.]|nr:HAMP domain-containing histidine kinase [Aequorivita sp.]
MKKENPELLSEENKTRLEQKTITAAENLLISMEDILLWSKGQMDNFKPNFKGIEINELFNDLSKHFGSEENVEIRFENPQKMSVHTDENYLKTIMRNLTGNAIKALTATENPQIVWKAKEESGKVQLSIA